MRRRPAIVFMLLAGALGAAGPPAAVGSEGPNPVAQAAAANVVDGPLVPLPAAAVARQKTIMVRAAPFADARALTYLGELRYDLRPTIFEVAYRLTDSLGAVWLQVQVPGRPNGRHGWVPAESLDLLYSVAGTRIEIDRSERRLRLIRGGRVALSVPVAVGTRGAPTPLGSFYVTARFRPVDRFLGPFALETSAYAAISDWPRGGIVGLHGTSDPASVGRPASHGCLRVRNSVIRRLRAAVPAGTPIVIRR